LARRTILETDLNRNCFPTRLACADLLISEIKLNLRYLRRLSGSALHERQWARFRPATASAWARPSLIQVGGFTLLSEKHISGGIDLASQISAAAMVGMQLHHKAAVCAADGVLACARFEAENLPRLRFRHRGGFL
jgi:hypothetical protein